MDKRDPNNRSRTTELNLISVRLLIHAANESQRHTHKLTQTGAVKAGII
jgi:hypothetical protein